MTPSNQLFSVHIWAEQIGDGSVEWRGRVSSQPNGSVAYFRTWDDLIKTLKQQLGEPPEQTKTNPQTNLKNGDPS